MKKILMILWAIFWFWVGTFFPVRIVRACESYEECMNCSNYFNSQYYLVNVDGKKAGCWESNELLVSKAIAYKLDEISKKLDKPEVSHAIYLPDENAR